VCKLCDSGFALNSTTSAANHVRNKHPDSNHRINTSGESIKTKLADLFATLSISTQVPYAFFENPAFLSALDQFAEMVVSLEHKNQVKYFQMYIF
jgi:hypothetical protein